MSIIGKLRAFVSGGGNPAARVALDNMHGQITAIHKSQAVIEFDLDGTILTANENFLHTLGYSLSEVQGRHHSLFVEPSMRDSTEYRAFWTKLGRGEYDAGVYKRIGKSGKEVWIQATYNPIFSASGKLLKVVKFATDITEQKLRTSDYEGQIAAISKAQGVIEFELDGTIRTANANFLKVVGYTLDEIKGKHHSIFVTPDYRESAEYRTFWAKLGRGEYDAEQYKRIAKGGREVWIQASYNPIFDPNGRPFKVVKYVTDVTQQVVMAQQIQAAVMQTQEVITAAIEGDLSARIPTEGKSGDIEALCRGVNTLLHANMTLITSVKNAVLEVQTGAEEISSGNTDLSQRTEEQASSLEQTAASMEEMTSSVRQTADNASQASQLAAAARQQAEKGGTIVGSAVTAMSQINTSSRKIADIITVIDEIAFQTNLLALNAAVEAARAGEQGRGFAVVASEVRSLAGRSATAAKEIKGLIQDSVAKVAEGSKLVDESGKALDDIVLSVKKVTDIVFEIAAASAEQSTGIELVSKAVIQMDEVTQQNAALVEQAAAASQSIVNQAQALNQVVAHYRVGDEEGPVAAPRRPAAARISTERREPKRPWAKSGTSPAPARPAPDSKKSGVRRANGNGVSVSSDWQEF